MKRSLKKIMLFSFLKPVKILNPKTILAFFPEEFGSLKSFYNDAVNLLSLGDDSGFGNESMSSDFAEDSDRYTISGQNIEKIGQGPPDTVRNTDDNDDPPYTPPDDVDLISDEEIFVTSKKKKKHISDSLAETIAYAKKRYQCDSSSEEEDLEDERLQQSSLNSSKKSVDSASICKSSNILKSKYTANGLKKLKADYPARRTNQNPILTESSSNSKSVNSGSNETRGNVEKSFIGSSSSDHNSLPVTDDKVLSELAAVNKTGSVRMKVDKEIESETQKVEKSFWQDSEVRTLLQIMNKAKVLHLIDHTGLTNKNIYAKVAKLFVQAGFNRTQKQIEAKWKHLKSIYQEAKSSMKPSGTGTKKRKDFRYYEEMDAILGNRPKNSLSGVDSYVPHVESQAKSDAEDVEDKENDENRQAEPNVSSQSKKSKDLNCTFISF